MTSELAAYEGVTVVDRDGKTIGHVLAVHADAFTGRPGWVTVRTGWLHGKSLVPIGDEAPVDGKLHVAYDSDMIKNAPWVDLDRAAEHVDDEVERTGDDESIQDDKGHDSRAQSDHWQVYEYYGLPFGRPDVTGAAAPDVTIDETAAQTGQVGHTAVVQGDVDQTGSGAHPAPAG